MDFDHNNVRAALNEDRLSSLPDELIHKIFSRFDIIFVVQTCLLLSPRWKFIWTSMPCLNFSISGFKTLPKFAKFLTHVLSHRNHQVEVSSVDIYFMVASTQVFVRMIANYAFSHNVQELTVRSWPDEFPPCLFSSQTLKHLSLKTFILAPCLTPKTHWDFPALTTLYLSEISLCNDKRESLDLFSKCANLQNLTLKCFIVMAEVFYIITPRLSNLTLINGRQSNVINLIAPQLVNLTIIDCSMMDLNTPPGLSSFCYKGYHSRQWFKDQFHSVNKVTINLPICCSKKPYKEEDALGIINMLQELRSARFLTLNLDIVECISSFPNLLSTQPSPFSNLICLNIDSGTSDTCKVKMSTEARNFLLENSPNATFIMKDLPTKAMIAKEVKEKKKAKLVADIENLMKELQASLEKDNIFIERNQAIKKTKVVIQNLVDEIQVWIKKRMMKIESERGQIEEILARLGAQLGTSLEEMKDLFKQEINDVVPMISKKKQVRCLLDRLPKRQRKQMEARYSRQLEQTEALIAHQASHYNFLDKITAFSRDTSSTSEFVSRSKYPLAFEPSSSSTIIPIPSTSSVNPMP